MTPQSPCLVCGGASAFLLRVSGYTVLQCEARDCGHAWVDGAPAAQELAAIYDTTESALENSNAFQVLADYRRNPDAVRRYYQRDRIRHLAAHFPETMARRGAVLDVGCSSGAFLAVLRDLGFDVRGQDVAAPAVRAGGEALDLDLRTAALAECAFGMRFDLITCYDVIEHCGDPRRLLADIRTHLAGHGRLVIRTPNHRGWLLSLTGRRWLWYIPPAHLHFFNHRSLGLLLRDAGFHVDCVRTDAGTYLYLMRRYLFPTPAARGPVSVDMPAWRQRAVFGLDATLRLLAAPPLALAARRHCNPVLEMYAHAV